MDMRTGWSGDIGGTWTKFDVAVDMSDVQRVFRDAGHSVAYVDVLTENEIFKLQSALVEKYTLVHKMNSAPQFFLTDESKASLAMYSSRIKDVIADAVQRDLG